MGATWLCRGARAWQRGGILMHKQIFRRRTLVRAASFLLAAFVVVGGLALQARARAEAYRLYLENGYRHAFAELSANLNELDVALQKGIRHLPLHAGSALHPDLRQGHVRPDGAG